MVKSIIKEIIIILLLVITILLILGILFYDYRPSTKKIPSQVAEYTLPQDMQKELEETLQSSEGQNIIKVYRVTSDDLKIHERNNDYIKGRTNPFDKIDATSTGTGSSSNNTNTSNSTGTGSQNPSGGKFLNNVVK